MNQLSTHHQQAQLPTTLRKDSVFKQNNEQNKIKRKKKKIETIWYCVSCGIFQDTPRILTQGLNFVIFRKILKTDQVKEYKEGELYKIDF